MYAFKSTVLIFCLVSIIFADNVNMDTSSSLQKTRIQFDPIGIFFGDIYLNVEYKFQPKVAVSIDGKYTLPFFGGSGYGICTNFRRYYSQKTFWGVYTKFGLLKTPYEATEGSSTFTLENKYVSAGLNWGKVWLLKNKYSIIFRAGGGYPIYNNLIWVGGNKPEYYKLAEGVTFLTNCLDGELSFGLTF